MTDKGALRMNPMHWLPPMFSGKSSVKGQAHWDKWEYYIEFQGLEAPRGANHDHRVTRFKGTLKDEAKTWYTGQGNMSFAQLQERFLARFGRIPTLDEDHQTLMNARLEPGETFDHFAAKLEVTRARLGIDGVQ
jgi:hypothetical protein